MHRFVQSALNRPALLAGLSLLLLHSLPARSHADGPRFASDRPMDMRHIKLELGVDLQHKHVDGVATLSLTALREISSVRFNAVDFETRSVNVAMASSKGDAAAGKGAKDANGKPMAESRELGFDFGPGAAARYVNDGKQIEVFFGKPIPAGQEVTVRIEYSVHEPKDGLHFFAPSEDEPDAPYQVWSQGQAEENKFWIPCFDHPNERQTSEVIVTVDEKYLVSSNGRLLPEAKPVVSGKKVFHWLQDQPHVVYLMTLVVGEFYVKEETWRGKPIQYWVPEKRKDDIDNSFGNTLKMLDFFSDKIGVEYAWPKYSQLCCYEYGGGMENTSATTLGENTLHDKRAHLDSSSDGLVAHELAHQWWGDLLTCKEWAHLWLNEGFASYFEALWDEHSEGPDEFAYNMWEKSGGAINGGRDRPIVDRYYSNPGQMFDSRAYPKGAWVLHMLRRRLGDDKFWKVLNRYCEQHQYGLVETSDLRKKVEEMTGQSWEQFFYDWTERPGCPSLDVTYSWDEAEKSARVVVKQTQGETKEQLDKIAEQWRATAKEPFHFPLTLEFRFADGGEPVTVTRQIAERETTILVPLAKSPNMMRVDPGNTVLKELKEHKGRDMWVAQLTGDPDVVGRIRAATELAEDKTDPNRTALGAALRDEKFWGVQTEIAQALGKMRGDIARDALLEGAKSPNHKTRRECVSQLGVFDKDKAVIEAVRKIVTDGDASYRVEQAAISAYGKLGADDVLATVKPALDRPSQREMIRNAALEAIGTLDDAEAAELLKNWTSAERPRECRRAATSALARVAERGKLDDATVSQVLATLTGTLTVGDRQLRSSSARGLGALGGRATSALPGLRKAADSDKADSVRAAAKEAVEKIQRDKPSDEQLADLRKRLDEMKAANDKLADQIKSLEARQMGRDQAGAGASAVGAAAP